MRKEIGIFIAVIVVCLASTQATVVQMEGDQAKIKSSQEFEECLNELLNFKFEQRCLLKVSSVSIGYMLMTFALIVKFPQIYKIYQAKSTAGITETYFYIDFVNVTNVVAWFRHYNYPFNTYGDSVSILAQQVILIGQMWYYDKTISLQKKLIMGTFFATHLFVFIAFDEAIPEVIWSIAKSSIFFFLLISRIPQIKQNYQDKSTGKLSVITLFLVTSGQVLKIFSLYNQLADVTAMTLQVASLCCNSILFTQILMYGDKSDLKKTKKE